MQAIRQAPTVSVSEGLSIKSSHILSWEKPFYNPPMKEFFIFS